MKTKEVPRCENCNALTIFPGICKECWEEMSTEDRPSWCVLRESQSASPVLNDAVRWVRSLGQRTGKESP